MQCTGRKHPARQPVYNSENRANIVFVTICTRKRQTILANDTAHKIIRQAWSAADHWAVGRYVIMPDHIHLFCAPATYDHLSIKRWIAFWKAKTSLTWPTANQRPIWQIDAWDTQLRTGDSYSAKWAYVRNNPIRHQLVARAEDWPYQGEMHSLLWHD